MLHFKNTSSDRSLSDILALFGRSTMPPWLKTLSTGALEDPKICSGGRPEELQQQVYSTWHSSAIAADVNAMKVLLARHKK